MPAFTLPIDIINRGLQIARQPRINTLADHSEQAIETVFLYDKLREAELQGNFWRFATKRVMLRPIGIDTVLYTPPTWAAGTFSPGAIVSYSPTVGLYAGQVFYWTTRAAKTGSNTTTPELDVDWQRYTGPVAVDLYDTGTRGDSTTAYQAGELVLVPAAWAVGTTYAAGAVVRDSTTWYVSLAATNVGNAVTDTTWWTPWTSRGRSDGSYGVTASDSPIPLTYPGTTAVYASLYSNNEDNPVSATGNWLAVTGTIAPLQIAWPLGAGPLHDLSTANVYRLPYSFLKKAPTDPKAGMVPYLGAASGASPEDYVLEDQYLLSKATAATPLMLRFVANVVEVPTMDALFCEMLAAKIAEEGAASFKTLDPRLLPTVISKAIRSYRDTRRRAVLANAIEIGPVAQIENRYVTARV